MTERLVELRDATKPCGSRDVGVQTAAQILSPNIRGEQVPQRKGGFTAADSDHALRDSRSARPTSMKQKPGLSERVDTGAWRKTGARQGVNLALATWVSVINFWAWNMIGPLSTTYAEQMSLNSIEASLLVATPILVGSLGRIVAGPLTDRFGGRIMLVAVSLASVVSVLAVGAAGAVRSYPLLLAFGFFLGVAGTVFAAGVPFVSNWFEPARRGLATGIFGAGMIGTGLSAFFTPRLLRWFGLFTAHVVVAVALAVTAALCVVVMRNGPGFTPNTAPVLPKLKAATKLPLTWEMSFIHAVVFGGFVAFSNYLPTYLKTIYGFSAADAGTRTAGFVLAATLARPVGGWLSDRIAPKYVVLTSLAGFAVLAFVAVFQPPPDLWSAATFIPMATFLGAGTGAVVAWVAQRAPAASFGSVTGIVSGAGGLGGYFPPLVMGATYDRLRNDYTIGLLLLVVTALVAFGYTKFQLAAHELATGRAKPPS
jgi:MFS transporter, NNP family, nitrate/nitrite transporter